MTPGLSERKIKAARASVATAVTLTIVKLITAFLTGSMTVLSSAVDSILDIFMSGINFFAIRHAEQPADENHPFGHGKFETLATVIQSLFIATSGGWIIYEAASRIGGPIELRNIEGGIAVLVISSIVSFLIARYLKRVAKETDSSALEADSLHFSMDIYTNLGLVVGLILIRFFDLPILDPILSILVACYILFEAFKLVRHALGDVLDEELPSSIQEEVTKLIVEHDNHYVDFHRFRTRRAGSQKIMDFHLTVCRHMTVQEAHDIADHLENSIKEKVVGSDVTIHLDPCEVKLDDEGRCPSQHNCPRSRALGTEAETFDPEKHS